MGLQAEIIEQCRQAQAVIEKFIDDRRAIAVQLSENQAYAAGLQNTVMQKDEAINLMSDKHASLAAEVATARQKAIEDAQSIVELKSDRDEHRLQCLRIASGPPVGLQHPDVAEMVRNRCAELLRASAERYAGQLAEAEKLWQAKIQEQATMIESLQDLVNNSWSDMAQGAGDDDPPSGRPL